MHCPQIDRLRNQIASDITAVPASEARTKGLSLLKQLVALAPDLSGTDALMGMQKAVFLIQHLEKWVLADEDDAVDQDTQCFLTVILLHLSPILQGITGGHWEFIFDVLENSLEVRLIAPGIWVLNFNRGRHCKKKVLYLSYTIP